MTVDSQSFVRIPGPLPSLFGVTAITVAPFIFDGGIGSDQALWHHEATHLEQQRRGSTIAWLIRYARDPQFRLTQELEATGRELYWRLKLGQVGAWKVCSAYVARFGGTRPDLVTALATAVGFYAA